MNRLFLRLALAATITLSLGGTALIASGGAQAFEQGSISAINVEAGNVILHGYDSVAYFAGTATQGEAQFSVEYQGVSYRFASAENMKTFQASPAQYVPQYGGFCALGTALGKKLDVDPTQFRVVDGKLYLNLNADVFKKWAEDVPGNIAKADANWPSIKSQAPSAL